MRNEWEGEELLVLDNDNYLFIQDSSEGGYDYSYIDGETRLTIDGGVLESDEPVDAAINAILVDLGLSGMGYGRSSLDYWEDFAG